MRLRWPWPLPALAVWSLAWGLLALLRALGLSLGWSLAAAGTLGVVGSLWGATRWRRLMIALGFPLSWSLASGVAGGEPWLWLLPLAAFVLVYPPSTWKDAPLYPTPADALGGLREAAPLPFSARVLDAGCGLGDGLMALDAAYPDVHLHGIERSVVLRWLCVLRCRRRGVVATVRGGDMWAEDWSGYDLVYLFQRPETMPRAMAKAARELREGAWLVSLEFADPTWAPHAQLDAGGGRPLWVYRAPLEPAAGAGEG